MNSPDTIRVVYKLPGLPAEVRVVENTLEALQALVGGYIEAIGVNEEIHAYIDEGGRLKKDPKVNFVWEGEPIVGPAVFSRINKRGDEIGFTSDEEALRVCGLLNL